MLRFTTPILILFYGIVLAAITAIPDVRTPLHGVGFMENLHFMFARVYWSELLSSYTFTSLIILFASSFGFAYFRNRWVKVICFVLLISFSYFLQLRHIVNQANVVLADAQYWSAYEQAAAEGYPFAFGVVASFCFSILLVTALVANCRQLLHSFQTQSD